MTNTTDTLAGDPLGGGFDAGQIIIDGVRYALIVAPKAVGEHKGGAWIGRSKDVSAAKSYYDGLLNTRAMAASGSKLAQWALELRIGGFDDWYIPALDELEVIYRSLKPTEEKNSGYARSGINLSASPPTWPYTPDFPVQTMSAAFRSGGVEAFDAVAYWSSTQHESYSTNAWDQHFLNGYQYDWRKDGKLRARAVRRLAI